MRYIIFPIIFMLLSSCGLKLSIKSNSKNNNKIAGIISPLVGAISSNDHSSFLSLFSTANAVSCADPVYAKLFKVQNDGSIDETNPISSQIVNTDASYSFDIEELGLIKKENVQYVVKADGCNSDVYKRPITDFNNKQNLDVKTTIVAEVVNANTLLTTTLNNAPRVAVQELIDSMSGSSIPAAITSITTEAIPSAKFSDIFGASPTVIQNGKPGVTLSVPSSMINELAVNTFSAHAYHLDPSYSFAYSWKINGVVASQNVSWSYIPGKNDSGLKTIDFYAGKDDGTGHIDLTKPYYTRTFSVFVNNNILPTAPNISLNASNPSPVNSNSISIDIATGAGLSNCASFSHLAITETSTPPGSMLFNIACATNGTQTEVVTFTNTEGPKTIYIWAIDNEGEISSYKSLNLVLDTLAPDAHLTFTPTLFKGGSTQSVTLSASDDGAGLSSLALYFSSTGVNPFSLVSTLGLTATSYSWNSPSIDTVNGKLKLVATDLAGRTTEVLSNAIAIDSTPPPAPAFSRTSAAHTNVTTVSTTIGSCSDISSILITETNTSPSPTDSGWAACSTAAGGFTKTVSGQGTHTLYAWAKDSVNNVTTSANTVTMILDTIAPSINSGPTTPLGMIGGSTQAVTWNITDTNTVTAKLEYFNGTSWSDLATGLSNSGTYSWSVPSSNLLNAKLRLTATDVAGNPSTATSSDLIIDSLPPAVDSLSLNSGALTTTNNNVLVTLTAHDALSKIKYFCLKYDDSTKPAASNSCWKDVTAPTPGITPNKNISFSNYYFQIGFLKGSMTVYAWVKDEAEQVSNNAASLNIDRYAITYDPGTPPALSTVQVTNSNTPSTPITGADLQAPTSGDIYIKWNASDIEGLAASPITLEYSTNDKDFSSVPGTTTFLNAANGSCTVDTGFTGCAKIPSISNAYYKVRVIATDTLGTTTFLNSAPLNEQKLRILAGNTDDGLNGSAVSAMFPIYGSISSASHLFQNKLAVSDDGKFFYIDKQNGLVWINPATGVLKKFIPTGANSTGDGGPVSAATLKTPIFVAMDFKNNLLIWDNDRIRKVDLSTMTISTIIGSAGTETDPSTTIDAQALKLPVADSRWTNFTPLPNGDIIFSGPVSTLHDRRYRAIDQKIVTMTFEGVGFTDYPTDLWSASNKFNIAVAFNPTTSAINFMAKGFYKAVTGDALTRFSRIDHTVGNETTPYPGITPYDLTTFSTTNPVNGADGNIYLIDRTRTGVKRYNYATNTATTVLGIPGTYGVTPCAENTLATSCAISIDSMFVSKNGRIYFVDMGKIRTINDSGRVITLFGQHASYGNGQLATTARFGLILDVRPGKYSAANDKLIIEDTYSREFREFTIGGNVSKVTNVILNGHFETDISTGDLLASGSSVTYFQRYSRTSNTWSNILGNPTTGTIFYDPLADGKVGSDIKLSGYGLFISGFTNNKLILSQYGYSAGYTNCFIKSYDTSDSFRQANIAGTGNCNSTNDIVPGDLLKNQPLAAVYPITSMSYIYDSTDLTNKYFFTRYGANIYSSSGQNSAVVKIPTGTSIASFTYSNVGNNLVFYFCSNTTLKLYKLVYATGVTSELPWLSPTLKCKASSQAPIYNAERNSVIFPYTQNTLDGVAEYDLN